MIKYGIEVAGVGRRTKVWRVIGKRDDIIVYRGFTVYGKAVALKTAAVKQAIEDLNPGEQD
jgi:hypothetical protein